MFYCYILCSLKDKSYYIGSTSNLSDRFLSHSHGNELKVRSTRFKRPFELIYYEEFQTLAEAVKRERQIKSWKKRVAIERLVKKQEAAIV